MNMEIETDADSLRVKAQDAAREFKSSWIELGQYLFSVYRDRLFKKWGYLSFETYCLKDLSIKQATASKLVRSYQFLEKEEPRLVDAGLVKTEEPRKLPDYESVNLLRLAQKNDKLTPTDVGQIRDSVLNKGREPKEVRAQVKKLIEENEHKSPDQLMEEKKISAIKRLASMLATIRRDLGKDKVLPDYLLKQMSELEEKLRNQLE